MAVVNGTFVIPASRDGVSKFRNAKQAALDCISISLKNTFHSGGPRTPHWNTSSSIMKLSDSQPCTTTLALRGAE